MQPRRGYADGPFGQIHYQDTVEGHNVLLLCSQAPMTSDQFQRAYPLFAAAGIRAIGIDTLGYGMSDGTAEAPTIADYATSIPAVMDHLGIDVAHLCGHHTGAIIATEAALSNPERVASMVLAGPVPLNPDEQQEYLDTFTAEEKAFAAKADGTHLSELYMRRLPWIEAMPNGLDLCTNYIVQTLMGAAPFWYGHNAAFRYDHGAALRQITQPTLVLTNTGDMIYPLAQRTMELCPHFSYAELDGGGVDIVEQAAAAWTAEVIQFLNKHTGND